MATLLADAVEIHDFGASVVSPARRIVACNYYDKVIMATPGASAVYWRGHGVCALLPGLVPREYFRGVSAFQGHLILWDDKRLKWSRQNDFAEWIPVSETTFSAVFKLLDPYTKGVFNQESGTLYVNKDATGLFEGQYLRIDSAPNQYSFFLVGKALPSTNATGVVSGFFQTVGPGESKDLFLTIFVPYLKDAQIYFANSIAILQVQADAEDEFSDLLSVTEDFESGTVGGEIEVEVDRVPEEINGRYVSIGPSANPGSDIYYVERTDPTRLLIILRRIGVGTALQETHYAGEVVSGQPFLRVKNLTNTVANGTFVTPLHEKFGFTVTPVDLTGAAPVGKVYPIGTEIFTVDANGAGETPNAGTNITGRILHFDTLADYGFIFKNRSIQSVQYVGNDQGTFFMRPEVTDEGFIGDYSFVKVGKDVMFFWGHADIYRYSGGSQLAPIAQQYTKQLFAELDRTKANQIIGFHNENDSEIWFIYPSKAKPDNGACRIFIYNYVENSCAVDDYADYVSAFGAAHRMEWTDEVLWDQAKGTWEAPESWDVITGTWESLAEDAPESFNVIAGARNSEGAALEAPYDDFTRGGEKFPSVWETIDLDADDPIVFKYVDTVVFAIQVHNPAEVPFFVNVTVGVKDNLDDDLKWSPVRPLQIQGNGTDNAKVNIICSGRYVRIRLDSNTRGVHWRVSRLRVLGRMGGSV